MKVREILNVIDQSAPRELQESYDNSGILTGDINAELDQMLVCLDITEEVISEAIEKGIKLVVSHHPLIFQGIKNLNPTNPINRILISAIKNDIVLFSAHTNLDKVNPGVSFALADKIGLVDQAVLVPESGSFLKLITFIPKDSVDTVSKALFDAGAGKIGNYDSCSYRLDGEGTFRALEGANPHVGEVNVVHTEPEIRFEAIVPRYLKSKVLRALIESHPYEEVAFDLIALENSNMYEGLGVVGKLSKPMAQNEFLNYLKDSLTLNCIRHTSISDQLVSTVAVCGGSGSEFLKNAKSSGAQVYVSADFKYHQFFDANSEILIADIGHYESEIFSLEVIKEIVTKNFPNFAVHLSKVNTNPIKYL